MKQGWAGSKLFLTIVRITFVSNYKWITCANSLKFVLAHHHIQKGLELEKYRYKIHYIQETVLEQKGIINSLLSNISS